MTKYKTCTEYWLDRSTGTFRGEFEAMYRDIDDPWGCEAAQSALTNQIFIELLFHGGRRFTRCVDIGCGLGGLLSSIHARNAGGEVLGLDVSQTAITKAGQRHPGIEFRCHNILDQALDEAPFDLVVVSEVLWYVLGALPLFFDRVDALLAPGGTLAVHQYFPTDQRFGREQIDGMPGFLGVVDQRGGLTRQHLLTAHTSDGVVMLATFIKD